MWNFVLDGWLYQNCFNFCSNFVENNLKLPKKILIWVGFKMQCIKAIKCAAIWATSEFYNFNSFCPSFFIWCPTNRWFKLTKRTQLNHACYLIFVFLLYSIVRAISKFFVKYISAAIGCWMKRPIKTHFVLSSLKS